MSQSFIIVNPDKGEFLDPLEFGDGNTLTEIVAQAACLKGLALLTAAITPEGGGEWSRVENPIIARWAGDRIVIASDFNAPRMFLPEGWEERWEQLRNGRDFEPNAYVYHRVCGTNISGSVIVALTSNRFEADRIKLEKHLTDAAAVAHGKLVKSGYFLGKQLDSEDLSAFDVNGFEEDPWCRNCEHSRSSHRHAGGEFKCTEVGCNCPGYQS